MENLVNWGVVEEVGEKQENAKISKWLMAKESGLSMNMKEGSMSKKDEPSKRMKQLEL